MCRSIKVLRKPDKTASTEEMKAAALQFVRKISGFHKPSQANQVAFDAAVFEVAEASRKLLQSINAKKAGAAPVQASTRPAIQPGL